MLRRRLLALFLTSALATAGFLVPTAQAAPRIPTASVVSADASLDGDLIAARLKAVSRKNLESTAWAVYTADGEALVVNDKLMVPASTSKTFTALAAIDVLGADKTFTTKVVSAKKGAITLVGGGDPYLTNGASTAAAKKANLASLAKKTAKALKKQKVKSVKLTYSAPLYSGPSYSPSWKESWRADTPRIMSLMVNGGMSGGKAHSNPARTTADLFAKRLKAEGIKVTSITSASAPKGAKTVASVTSARLGTMVRRMLRHSDNVAAETFARHIAIKTGREPTFGGGSTAIAGWMKSKDLWAKGMKIDGGSGLSSKTKVTPSVLARSIGLALSNKRYVDVVKGLPIAGVDGTLKQRFDDPSEKAGREVVHAKTGMLKQVRSLSGYVTTKDGQVLTFALLATHDGTHSSSAINWLDRSATTLATCGCLLAGSG